MPPQGNGQPAQPRLTKVGSSMLMLAGVLVWLSLVLPWVTYAGGSASVVDLAGGGRVPQASEGPRLASAAIGLLVVAGLLAAGSGWMARASRSRKAVVVGGLGGLFAAFLALVGGSLAFATSVDVANNIYPFHSGGGAGAPVALVGLLLLLLGAVLTLIGAAVARPRNHQPRPGQPPSAEPPTPRPGGTGTR